MTHEDYVSFETAKLLKEKGFDGSCHRYYRCDKEDIDGNGKMFMFASDLNGFCCVTNSLLNNYGDEHEETVLAPTFQMAMKWLREKGFHIFVPNEIDYDEDERGNRWYHQPAYYPEIRRVSDGKIMYDDGSLYATPEQACEVAIKYCLENLI